MKRYLVLHRYTDGKYSVWSSYDNLENISADMYEEFREALPGTEYIVVDLEHTGNGIVRIYSVERRVVFRDVGALERAWPPLQCEMVAYNRELGDGAFLVRFSGKVT